MGHEMLSLPNVKSDWGNHVQNNHEMHELSNAEIAEIMDMKSAQVAVLLHRALNSFKKKFKKNFKKSEIF
jgi:predicted XRE-type DNA-binding protein